ncbi:uncharacterized protein LAESUDRAFT_126981 [Laetiporus sulphureus 93-53]|uniref:Secreted protein n=1 Tax=Laetiporus sulphureus 93-53 TaxID=1314785 RepID=A0A165EG14_9APHY|nr:uncharacterized protein LAESUDRAFT_126981 [Laetiporus sulphureus 93-53]KZT06983.1 hypothetical protein LAESUDRAFT_126981 [Laetiporus sulphureus 93-53]
MVAVCTRACFVVSAFSACLIASLAAQPVRGEASVDQASGRARDAIWRDRKSECTRPVILPTGWRALCPSRVSSSTRLRALCSPDCPCISLERQVDHPGLRYLLLSQITRAFWPAMRFCASGDWRAEMAMYSGGLTCVCVECFKKDDRLCARRS